MMATFLDRDGVINRESGFVKSVDEFMIYENAAAAIKLLKKYGPVIVVTNQPQVARGLITEQDINDIHKHMIKELALHGAFLDAIYYCPHHPEIHDDVPEWARKYRIACTCRKPGTGMLEQAAKDFSLDLKECFIIGDRTIDMLAGKTAGCRTILVKTGKAGTDGKYSVEPDYVCDDIYAAAELISGLLG